ncbi:Chromate resistance protein ChrB [Demequina lutea]|uniref:ChrB N-terminal domain-containing protein n=1 Tax=Demequina lutea TaxID=431489 RepID=A0A7Y9ZBU1_9MICO|nr:Chromate resistance protein ChrB [Demequina lutea]NYI42517.1 hypothetical protein [Demequina lutea]
MNSSPRGGRSCLSHAGLHIDREIAKKKFTFGELEEEEQSLERLQRWMVDLDRRQFTDVAETEAAAAREALNGSVAALNNYAGLVYDATRIASDPMPEVDNA